MAERGRGAAERYAPQVRFRAIGARGQERLAAADVAVVGLGALGTVSAGQLVRAGVGRLRLIDRDLVEWSNLQRQILYDEDDARRGVPKAIAAAEHLRAVNAAVQLVPAVIDVTPRNVEGLLADCDLVVDGTGNLETRFLLNDACLHRGLPWVYAGAVGSSGSVMAIVPGRTPCLRCLIDRAPAPGALASCEGEGVLAATTGVAASLQVAEALQILVGAEAGGTLTCFDLWGGADFQSVAVSRREDCPACGAGRYEYLSGERYSWTTVLCGRNSVQVSPAGEEDLSLDLLAKRLAGAGPVTHNGFTVSVRVGEREILVFPDGRAIIHGTTDEAEARSLYARYVGA